LPLKASHKEHLTIVYFLWAEGLRANDIHSESHPDQYIFDVRSLFVVENCCWWGMTWPGCSVISMTDATTAVTSVVQSHLGKCLNWISTIHWKMKH